MPPPGLTDVPEPRELRDAFAQHGEVDWGADLPTTAEIARQYGVPATVRSLELLKRAVATEPRITAQVLAAMPPSAAPYQLASRIKSPHSLARKLRDAQRAGRELPPEDLLRYTVLTEHEDALVASTRRTIEGLGDSGWQVTYAMHSYTEDSRYKGIHAHLATPPGETVEVQFHSLASAKVKEATTPYYEIERSADATLSQRAAARQECVRLSATLAAPRGIDGLKVLGGIRLEVNNYSDSRQRTKANSSGSATDAGRPSVGQTPTTTRTDGIQR
ncbi:hypothetical protein [Kribbella sp. CA-293567]|uniref:hypothetical protein n=1 Tax=Kribbella sp. CA-293567 TaxID=3002436 RepID=UPI0022DDF8B0|nr:hypothetical protein [Kribbella sp. CA-293567]WBQ07038.1 hypothetical protein OX958_09605 [Kribbella sp. CA-293567]